MEHGIVSQVENFGQARIALQLLLLIIMQLILGAGAKICWEEESTCSPIKYDYQSQTSGEESEDGPGKSRRTFRDR